ncbi:CRISPR-associated endonuclease Cas2 [Donghicola mangrovi]|uniref:CRISPR-associated endoribonuclease Cas2 n=1 Tax=Donghicola mangrovi TaxID=2729614 RepID=A0A850Q8L1_9RHOB|nr:CRISPR-associated endonuclease Cas2 [Donghicola mangrovi]NVO23318.1 CRISPR-associated endonuclease Cas2 [Donghicola mangrovi]
MARTKMLMVFVYDVSSAKRRRKVAGILEKHATRVQYSVFEARLSQRKADTIAERAATHLDAGDSLRMYAVGADGFQRSRVFGSSIPMQTAEGFWLI